MPLHAIHDRSEADLNAELSDAIARLRDGVAGARKGRRDGGPIQSRSHGRPRQNVTPHWQQSHRQREMDVGDTGSRFDDGAGGKRICGDSAHGFVTEAGVGDFQRRGEHGRNGHHRLSAFTWGHLGGEHERSNQSRWLMKLKSWAWSCPSRAMFASALLVAALFLIADIVRSF